MNFFTRYCSHCLKNFCPDLNEIESDNIKFFVPTIDELERNHFIFVEIKKSVATDIFACKEKKVIDIKKHATILHI